MFLIYVWSLVQIWCAQEDLFIELLYNLARLKCTINLVQFHTKFHSSFRTWPMHRKKILLPTTCMSRDQGTILGIDREIQLVHIGNLFFDNSVTKAWLQFWNSRFFTPNITYFKKKTNFTSRGAFFDTKANLNGLSSETDFAESGINW